MKGCLDVHFLGHNKLATSLRGSPTVMKTTSSRPANYLDLADELRRRIQSREWKPGDKLPSYSESKELFGAHSVVLEKAHAQLEGEGLIVRERGRGVFVARSAPQPRLTQTGLIGVAGQGFAFQEYSPYWVKLLRGIREVCAENLKQIILLDNKSNVGWEQADGVLICDWSNQLTMRWLPPAMPCVSVLVPESGMPSVYADDHAGGRAATEHLLQLGHKKIAFLHTRDTSVAARRVAGWREALQQAGIQPRAEWEKEMRGRIDYGARFVDYGRKTMREWLNAGWSKTGCTAIVAHNDETAVGIIEALQEARLRVPKDVSVIGFDGAQPPEYSPLPLTTIQVPLEEIGHEAMKMLLHQVNGEPVGAANRVFPVTIVEGRTSGRVRRATGGM